RFFPLLEHGHAVLAAETEAVHDDVADRQLAGFPWHVVEVTLGIWRELVDGGRDATRLQRFDRRYGAQRAGRAQQMADHRFHRADWNAVGVLAERKLQRLRLGRVIQRCARAVRAIEMKASGSTADSVPPATTAATSPRRRKCSDSNIEYTPAAQAAVFVTTGPLMPYVIDTWQEAMLGIISGTIIGPTRSQPLVTRVSISSATARMPPPPVAMMAPMSQALESFTSSPASARA